MKLKLDRVKGKLVRFKVKPKNTSELFETVV